MTCSHISWCEEGVQISLPPRGFGARAASVVGARVLCADLCFDFAYEVSCEARETAPEADAVPEGK